MNFFFEKKFFQRPKNTHSQCVFSDFLCSYVVQKKCTQFTLSAFIFELKETIYLNNAHKLTIHIQQLYFLVSHISICVFYLFLYSINLTSHV